MLSENFIKQAFYRAMTRAGVFNRSDTGIVGFARDIERAAMAAAFERAAVICDERALKNEHAAEDAITNGEHDDVSSLRAAAWQMNVCANAIRAEAAKENTNG